MTGLSQQTILEIFGNPYDLMFSVGQNGEWEKFSIGIFRGPGHNFKPLIASIPFADKPENAVLKIKEILEYVCVNAGKNSKDTTGCLNPELIELIITELRVKRCVSTVTMVPRASSSLTLHKLIPPENQTLFEQYPELNHIWEIPTLQQQARESYEHWGTRVYPKESTGEIFSIDEDGMPIGIIGWFEYGEFPEVLRLRYYGIVPSRRGKGYGQQAMKLFLQHLSVHAPKHALYLAESVSATAATAPLLIAHFKKMGFVEFNDPNYGDNAPGCPVLASLKIRIPGR